jgi:hypothetical protein
MKNISIHLTGIFISIVLAIGAINYDVHSTPRDSNSRIRLRNITRTDNLLEIKPRFAENGSSVLFLVFNGDYLSPKPWDYRLSKSDRDGHASHYLTSGGVLDYTVLPDEQGILVLKVNQSFITSKPDCDSYDEIQGWELWYFSLKGNERVLLESSKDLHISVGHYMLGLGILPELNSDEYLISSPQKTVQILIRREKRQDLSYFRFYDHNTVGGKEVLFETESWKSYSQTPWWPTMTWLDESKFITMNFESNEDFQFTQHEGLFSIVKVDLKSNSQEILFKDSSLSPFPRMVLDPSAANLYFQKFGEHKDVTELWSLNLETKVAEMIYKVKGELGEVRFSLDGLSLIFTQLLENNFDIIRLDLDTNRIRSLAGK